MTPLLFSLSPFLVVVVGALLLMLSESFAKNRGGMAIGTTVVFLAAAACALGVWMRGLDDVDTSMVMPWIVLDKFSLFFCVLLCLGGALSSLLAGGYLPEHNLDRGEFYTLLLLSTFGAMVLAASGDMLTLFIGLETMSLGVYALTAFRRASPRSAEGAVKYFLLGSFAAALMLYGFALIYGATGTTQLMQVGSALRGGLRSPTMVFGLVLVLVGLAFKISAVPFHMWTPDAYEGAPTPATTFMAVVVKSAAFAMMLRVLGLAFSDAGSTSWAGGWPPVLAWLAVITMTVGNLVAGRQESVKRMLAYSSIAHAGYLLVGVVSSVRTGAMGEASVLFYLLTYTVSTAGAFGALILCGRRGAEAVSFEDLAGIGRRHPAAALPFALFLLSLAGIPPTAGFFGKWFLLKGAMSGGYTWLTIVLVLNSVLAMYYYLRVLVFMYFREPAAGAPIATPMRSGYVAAALILSAVLVILLGVAPSVSLDFALSAARGIVPS